MSTEHRQLVTTPRRRLGWTLALWCCLPLGFGACFGGEFVQGLPCEHDADCGPQLSCIEGFCGGLGDPALCGNGLIDVGEDCDDGNVDDGDACTSMCRLPVCGDGLLGPAEACDDGNVVDGDACTANCQLPGTCGNGIPEDGEACDDGNTAVNDTCTPACQLPTCGDGYLSIGEECDDGNDVGTDDCTPTCRMPSCGDGYLGAGELCDDGNTVETDMCTTACTESPQTPELQLSLAQVRQIEFHWQPALGADFYQLFERLDVGEEFVQVGNDIVGESAALTKPLLLLQQLHASYKLRACNAMRCVDSEVVDLAGSLAEAVGYFKASNTDAGDQFGARVALSGDGNTLAVSARGEDSAAQDIEGDQDNDDAADAGAIYVFTQSNGAWSQQAYIKAANTSQPSFGGENAGFGLSLALSSDGNTLAVGAPTEDGAATGINGDAFDNDASDAGAAYVFVRTDNVWTQQAYVKASNTEAVDMFGYSVALSDDGDTLAVGATGESSGDPGLDGDQVDNSVLDAGAVYMFERTGDVWAQQAYVKASNPGGADAFGASVALSGSGDTLAVGAAREDSAATGIGGDQQDVSASFAGAVYVFVRANQTWSQQAYVKASNTDGLDFFGGNVALSSDGDTLAVGALSEASQATGINGDQDDDSAELSGAVYVFVRTGGIWAQQAYVKASNTEGLDAFGFSLALAADGNTLAVGALWEDSAALGLDGDQQDNSALDAGAVYVFVRSGGVWSQSAYVKAPHSSPRDVFGTSVALSADASILAVGAPAENYASTGVGEQPFGFAFDAGAVYLY